MKNQRKLHPRNKHNEEYDFPALSKTNPGLGLFLKKNAHGNLSIDYGNPVAVHQLNQALLQQLYGVNNWSLPEGALCPPIPSRVDYIHWIADLLGTSIQHSSVKLLDIGTGASGIYPILAAKAYGWKAVGSDIDTTSLENVSGILAENPTIQDQIQLRHQPDKHAFFKNIVQPDEFFNLTCCNPPFYASAEEAENATQKKRRNLALNRGEKTTLDSTRNFGGSAEELWCKGGEALFLKKMIRESKEFKQQCGWFTTLVSQQENLKKLEKQAKKAGATDVKVLPMVHGNKKTRVLAWTFM